MSRIENWKPVSGKVVGIIYEDDRFTDGDIILTSRHLSIDRKNRILKTKNSTYTLGKEYFPNKGEEDVH